MEGLPIILLYLAVPGLLVSLLKRFLSSRQSATAATPKFPGPKQYPIVGRIHDLPRFSLWLKFKEWADEHGPIYQTRAVENTFIIISDLEIANDLLVKRSKIYSGRPQIRSLIGHKDGPAYLALMDRHDIWSKQRKWVHAAMAEAHRNHFYGHVERETARYLALMLLDPARFYDHTREFCGRVMCRLAWDEAWQGKYYGESADGTLHCMSVSGPITNTVTPLWSLPMAINPWKKHEIKREAFQRQGWREAMARAKVRFIKGDLPADTWAYRYFEQVVSAAKIDGKNSADVEELLRQKADQEEFACCTMGFLNLVGVVTISGPLKFFLMAMALHPEWQAKAQEEVDRVCGDRMPTIKDFANLPTVRACLKETVRWRSGVPLGVPHQCEEDDVYRGVPIKKGTIILACEWNINRLPALYPDAESFRPDRYLDPSFPTYQEPLTEFPNFRSGKGMHSFGWGRRTCLGQNIVDDEMFVFGAGVLWALHISQKLCPNTGKPIPINTQATNSHVILEPDPYEISIQARNQERARQVMEGYREVVGTVKFEQ